MIKETYWERELRRKGKAETDTLLQALLIAEPPIEVEKDV